MMRFIINELNGWPLFDPIFYFNNTNLIYKNLVSLQKYAKSPLVNIYVTTSPSDPNQPVLKVKNSEI